MLRRKGREGVRAGNGERTRARQRRGRARIRRGRRSARRGAITFVLSRENERGAAFPFERARQPPVAPCSTDTSRSQARDSSRSSWRARRVLRARGARLDVRRAAPLDRAEATTTPRRFRARESEDRVSARRDTLTRATRRQNRPIPSSFFVAFSRAGGHLSFAFRRHDTPRRRAFSPPPTPSRVRSGPTVGQDGEESQGKTSSRCVIAPPSRPPPHFPSRASRLGLAPATAAATPLTSRCRPPPLPARRRQVLLPRQGAGLPLPRRVQARPAQPQV